MGYKATQARREAAEIRKMIWRALIAFTIGIVIAMLAFEFVGDEFLHDICCTSLGRLPAYLLLGTGLGGFYLLMRYVSEGIYTGGSRRVPVGSLTIYAAMIVLSPLAFVVLVIYRFCQLAKLRKTELEDTEEN